MTKGQRRFWQFTLAAIIAFPVVGFVVYYGRVLVHKGFVAASVVSTPLESGNTLPPEFTQLVITEGVGRGPEIRGIYRKDGAEVKFFTARGPRISAFEQASGAGAYEIDACFIKDGRALVSVAGGHEVAIPECRALSGEMSGDEDSVSSAPEDMQLAYDAMRAIAELQFLPEYKLEQRALTSTLAFSVFAQSFDRVLGDQPYQEQQSGEVIIGPDEIGGRAIGIQ